MIDHGKVYMGILENRVFYMLNYVMVPINTRFTPLEMESALESSRVKDTKRLERGTDFDRVEQIYQKIQVAKGLYGVLENRFVLSK